MATRIISKNDLVSLTSLSFIRPQDIQFSMNGTKPNAKMYPFFDGIPVGKYISGSTESGGVYSVTTDASGSLTGTFSIPPATFNTGTRVLKFQDIPTFDDSTSTAGSTVGSASAVFTATGLKKTYQETISNTTLQIEQPPNIAGVVMGSIGNGNGNAGDPLAQSFFTYGVTGGCFVSKIDLYFKTVDLSIPVTVEIREMNNGYPSPNLVSSWASSTRLLTNSNVSNDASVATTFTFSKLIYLPENKDYCFVILANSNAYNVWSSEFGSKSIETGKTIFEQPYIGTMFKSDNNITWTAQQNEDIKFTLYKASFATAVSQLNFVSTAEPTLVLGDKFSVISGSPIITVNFGFLHGQRNGDKIYIKAVPNCVYRGIPASIFNNNYTSLSSGFVVSVIDEYTLSFNCGFNATSTGKLTISGIVNAVLIEDVGEGYLSTPTVHFSSGAATATAVMRNGAITDVLVTSGGTYTSVPTANPVGGTPTRPASFKVISETIFGVQMNRQFQTATPILSTQQPPGTSMGVSLVTTDYDSFISVGDDVKLNLPTKLYKNAVLMPPQVETIHGATGTTKLSLTLQSDNSNVSPVVNLGGKPRIRLQSYVVNNNTTTDETNPNHGSSFSRYISKIVGITTKSVGARVFVNAASTPDSSFDVYIRTSEAGSSTLHTSLSWVKLTCDVQRTQSTTDNDFKDYEFYINDLPSFDTYDLKIVLNSSKKYIYPKIKNYRCIILAT